MEPTEKPAVGSPEHMAMMRAARTGGPRSPVKPPADAPDPGTPVDQERQRAALEAETRKAREQAAKLTAAADKMERRLPLPAPITIVTGAPAPRGYPRKFTLERQREYLDAIARGTGVNAAAKLAGVSRQTIKNYRGSDPDFKEAEKEAVLAMVEDVEHAFFQSALAGNADAQWKILTNLKPEMWQPIQKLQVNVTGQVEHIDVGAALAEIDTLEDLLRARVSRQRETPPALEAGGVDDAEIVED